MPINTGSSPHPAESTTVLGGRLPGASAPLIRRVTRNYANGIQGNTKLQRRSALLRTFSNTCRDIHTAVKSKELAYGTCTHWHTSRNQHVNICTHARHEQQHRPSLCLLKRRTTRTLYPRRLFINPSRRLFMLTPPPNAKMAVTNPKRVRPP